MNLQRALNSLNDKTNFLDKDKKSPFFKIRQPDGSAPKGVCEDGAMGKQTHAAFEAFKTRFGYKGSNDIKEMTSAVWDQDKILLGFVTNTEEKPKTSPAPASTELAEEKNNNLQLNGNSTYAKSVLLSHTLQLCMCSLSLNIAMSPHFLHT